MWMIASSYGIGKHLNRKPYIDISMKCAQETIDEIAESFDGILEKIDFLNLNKSEIQIIPFGECCKYDSPERLRQSGAKYLELGDKFLQHPKYFGQGAEDITLIFNWSVKLKQKAEKIKKALFGSDTSHKLCVHTRRGDFVKLNIESGRDFTEAAVHFVCNELNTIHKVYKPDKMSRTEGMSFGALHCDSLLITASSSTFAWWIGYLMRASTNSSIGNIYLNSNCDEKYYNHSNFPSPWFAPKLAIIEHKKETLSSLNLAYLSATEHISNSSISHLSSTAEPGSLNSPVDTASSAIITGGASFLLIINALLKIIAGFFVICIDQLYYVL